MGEKGAGRRLVLRQPVLGTTSAHPAKHVVSSLAARGYNQLQIRGMISKYPSLLAMDLDSPTQQQKLDRIATVSPWTLDHFLASPKHVTAATRRLASRLDFIRQHGLDELSSPGMLATYSDVLV
jgi:hypothetical protein